MRRSAALLPLAAAVLGGVVMVGCAEAPSPDIDLSQATIIDVRPRLNWAFSHIEGARHVPWDCIYLGLQAMGIDEDDPVVLYGENEALAARAESSLRNMSYNQVLNAGSIAEARALLDRPLVQPTDRTPDAVDRAIAERCAERIDGLPDL